MYVHREYKQIIDLGSIVRNLKELLDSVVERFTNIQFKKENSLDNIVEKMSNTDNCFVKWKKKFQSFTLKATL